MKPVLEFKAKLQTAEQQFISFTTQCMSNICIVTRGRWTGTKHYVPLAANDIRGLVAFDTI